MIEKTTGIVLHSFKYGETSVIARVFTRNRGLQSYLVPGVRKSKAKIRNNLFQPLTPVDLVVYHKEKGGLQRIREISCPEMYHTIPFDILKSSIAIFLSELLTKSLKEQDPNPEMFDFIANSLKFLDHTEGKVTDFHLVFLMHLSRFLGFQPRNNFDETHCYFNLKEGLYQQTFSGLEQCLDSDLSRIFHQINLTAIEEVGKLSFNNESRRYLLKKTIDYYSYHLDGLQEIRSHFVLEMILN